MDLPYEMLFTVVLKLPRFRGGIITR